MEEVDESALDNSCAAFKAGDDATTRRSAKREDRAGAEINESNNWASQAPVSSGSGEGECETRDSLAVGPVRCELLSLLFPVSTSWTEWSN